MKKIILGVCTLILLAAATTLWVERYARPASPIALNVSNARWVSGAIAVNELMQESDLVIKARVSIAPVTRVLHYELPMIDKNKNETGSKTLEMLFSDTVFEVIKIYKGKPQLNVANITVMQTGGFDPKISGNNYMMADDPLYQIGEEYILFLVDISGDHVHAPDRELYRTVNPFGRYVINGENVFSYGHNPTRLVQLPATIRGLEAQIAKALLQKSPSPIPSYIPTLPAATETPLSTVPPTQPPFFEETPTPSP